MLQLNLLVKFHIFQFHNPNPRQSQLEDIIYM